MTKYSKSEVMKREWEIYKSGNSFYSKSFNMSLSRAWPVVKASAASRERKAKEQAWQEHIIKAKSNSIMFEMNMLAKSLNNYYANNTYNGD